jgi:DNA-binding transcriptional regulator GbsR (MarR family)
MTVKLHQLKQDFTEGLSQISRFWGFPKGMGAIFAVLYLSPAPLSLDEIVEQTGLTKGAVSTEVRTLARMGLVHRSSKLGDRKDYYEAESDFYTSIRSILKERQNSEFDRAVRSVGETLENWNQARCQGMKRNWNSSASACKRCRIFSTRSTALQRRSSNLENLGLGNVKTILSVLK